MRAIRPDKLTLAALGATLVHYVRVPHLLAARVAAGYRLRGPGHTRRYPALLAA